MLQDHWQSTCYTSSSTNKKLIHLYPPGNKQLQDDTPTITPSSQTPAMVMSLVLYPFRPLKGNMAPKQWNYTSSRLYTILEDSSMLHEPFLSKAPCLSIILSFKIKRMLPTEEHRTTLISFCVQTQGRTLWVSPQGNNFPHLTTILALQVDISTYQLTNFFPPNQSLLILLTPTRAVSGW